MRRRELIALAAGGVLGTIRLAATSRADGAPLQHLAIVGSPSDAGAEIYYAQDRGFFAARGLQAQILSLTSGAAVAAAMASGKYDVGHGNIPTIAAAHEAGLPYVLIAPGAFYSDSAPTTALVVAKDSPIETAGDLAGKTVANVSLQDIGTVALDRWLRAAHVAPERVHVIEMPLSSMDAALVRGTVDAAIVLEPFLSAGLATNTRLLGKIYSAIARRFMINGYYARADWVQANPQIVRAFAAAIVDAGRWANANHEASADLLRRVVHVTIAPGQARSVYADLLTPALIQPLINAAAGSNMLKEPLSAATLIAAP